MTATFLSRISLVSALALIAGFSSTSNAQDKLLPPTYLVGKKYDLEMTQNMVMDMTAMGAAAGQPLGKTNIDMTMGMVFVCKKHTTPGQRAVTMTFSRIVMDMAMGPMKMGYDSTDPASSNSPIAAGFKPLLDLEIVTILDENDKVVEIKGLEKLAGMQQLGPEQLKQMSDPAAQLGIPATGVALGQAWENVMDMPMGQQIGKVGVALNLKYEKDEVIDGTKCAVINYEGKMNMEMNANAGGAGPQMKVEDGELKGTMKFDKANRAIKEGTSTGKMKMAMPNPAGGNLAIPAEFDQKFVMKSITDA